MKNSPPRTDRPDRSAPARPRPRPGPPWERLLRHYTLPFAALLFLLVGAGLWLRPATRALSDIVWTIGLVLTGTPVVVNTVRGMLRGRFAADLVAMLAIVTAVLLGEPLPGLVVVLMQTGGEALERYAEGRASAAVRALEAEAPQIAHRVLPDGRIVDVPVDQVQVGETVLVRPGEMVPCDGTVVRGRSHVDTSRLTGEPLPVSAVPGTSLMSGSLNGEAPLTVRVTAISIESQYARIVELVRTAQASKSPLQRLADRYAVWFTPLTLAVAALAWAASGEVIRVLSVLVVATPCPLILATPVAIIGGINRAARAKVIFRHGTALEQLGKARVGVFDKTGTVTIGMPEVSRVVAATGFTEAAILRLAGSVERDSSHLLARTLVLAAERAGTDLPAAQHVEEAPGQGISGVVEGHRIIIGSRAFLAAQVPGSDAELARFDGESAGLRAYVAVDARLAGVVEYADRLRPNVRAFFDDLRGLGFDPIILLSGDHHANVQEVARAVGITRAESDLLPEDKVHIVKRLVADGHTVMMVGDGINDAPALSSASVGVALAGHGGGILAEAADVVVLVDELPRVAEGVRISRRTLRIAHQSIGVGLGLSGAAMVFAAFGMIPPAAGALIQEAIDVAVILNSIRASR